MNELKYIFEKPNGVTCFDRYFDYLEGQRSVMPESLALFAMDVRRYELNGASTLHDAWLSSLCVNNSYLENQSLVSSVKLDLLLATHRTVIALIYGGVKNLACSLTPDYWPDRPLDLLVHEFCVLEEGLFQHIMQFDRGVWIRVVFTHFDFVESEYAP